MCSNKGDATLRRWFVSVSFAICDYLYFFLSDVNFLWQTLICSDGRNYDDLECDLLKTLSVLTKSLLKLENYAFDKFNNFDNFLWHTVYKYH